MATKETKTEVIIKSKLADDVKAARRVSTPLLSITSQDIIATMRLLVVELNGTATPAPKISWDCVNGAIGLNETGEKSLAEAIAKVGADGQDPKMVTGNLAETLDLAKYFKMDTVLFVQNANLFMDSPAIQQAILNLREPFKRDRRTLILLSSDIVIPPSLLSHMVCFDEELPTEAELQKVLMTIYESAGLKTPNAETIKKAVDAVLGLPSFTAEQVIAMSLTPQGVDLLKLWERKRQAIEETPGLSVWRGGESFDQIGGCENAKGFLKQVLGGEKTPRCIVFMDEIEKMLGGAEGDTSGVSKDQLGYILSFMQDNEVSGCIFIGPPGAAKSAMAKSAGNDAGIPTISLDLGGVKGSLVGQSEGNLRRALKVAKAISGGEMLFIATCNKIAILPPELKRRFTFGTFFFDLPTSDERDKIWDIYRKKFQISEKESRPFDEGWTGAEIRQCCNLAWRLKISLVSAAGYIVPVAKSAAASIESLRNEASGKFVSASEVGKVYVYRKAKTPQQEDSSSRTISLG
jgi:SpoVK/Ycf46/Vps4 family AAA+-type ATPase